MSRPSNLSRQCPACKTKGHLAEHRAYPCHSVRRIACRTHRCRHGRVTLELYVGPPSGRPTKPGQAAQLLQAIVERDVETARRHVETRNARFAELRAEGVELPSTAIRTCPSCAEPGQLRYSSNYGAYVMHCYECTDRQCGERWITAEFPLPAVAREAALSDLRVCLELLRSADAERKAKKRASLEATQRIHRERAKLMALLTKAGASEA